MNRNNITYDHKLFRVISIWIVLTQSLPPLNLIFPFSNSFLFAVYIVITFFLFPRLFTKRSILSLFAYVLLTYLYHLSGNSFFSTINSVITVPLVMMGGLLMIEYAYSYDYDYKYTKTILYTIIAANVFMTILSIPQIEDDPDIIRKTSNIDKQVGYEAVISLRVMSYQTVHGIPLLFAPLAYLCRLLFRKNKKSFILWVLITFLLFYIVFRSNAATATLLSLGILLISFLFNLGGFNKKRILQLGIIGFGGFLLLQPVVLSPILDTLQGAMDPSGASYKRVGEIKNDIVYGEKEGDWAKRQDLYQSSTRLFLESPLFGTTTPDKISKHTWIIDRLALFGLVFIIPLVFVFVSTIKRSYHNLHHSKLIYSCGIVCLLILLYLKNDFAQGTWLYGFAYLPLLCRFVDFEMIKYNRIKKYV